MDDVNIDLNISKNKLINLSRWVKVFFSLIYISTLILTIIIIIYFIVNN